MISESVNGVCENVCFTAVKQYFCKFQGMPNSLKNESNVLLTLLLPKIDQIHENPSKLDPIRDIKIHQKPVRHGNGKRDMRKQAQQQCIPSYSRACQSLSNDSKWVFAIPRLGWSFPWGSQNCKWVLLTAPKASTCGPAHSWVFLRVRKHLHGFLSIPECAQAFSNIPETSSLLQIFMNIPIRC